MNATNYEETALDVYREDIEEALRINCHIVVHAGDGGTSYVREVKGQANPKTLTIGPVSEAWVEQLRGYIQGRMEHRGTRVSSSLLSGAQFALLRKRPG